MLVSNDVAEAMLNTVIVADVVISLHTADPGDNGANEITGAHRVTIESTEWNAYATVSDARVVTNTNVEEFTDEADATETATHFTMWEANGTTFILSNALTSSQSITAGNPIRIPAGSFTFGMMTTL